ncbi:MAG: GT4 family glycosyltransferase PelF [Eubacteriales bacterium]
MHICLFCEGSYPYIVGGVSSWVHTLIKSMPENTFSIVTLYPYEETRGKFKYDVPDNVQEIREFFLDTLGNQRGQYRRSYKYSSGDIEQIEHLLSGGTVAWAEFFEFFQRNKDRNAQDFLKSKVFYDAILAAYNRVCPNAALSDYFWTIRSMILPLVGILGQEMPKADLYHAVSTGYAGIMASMAKHQHGKAMVLTEHGIYTRERQQEIIGSHWIISHFKQIWVDYFHSLSLCAYAYADVSVTLFKRAQDIQAELGCPTEKQLIIQNGVNVEPLGDERQELFKDRYNVGAIVRVVPIKDIITMLQAFRYVLQNTLEAKFYIMGPTDEDPEYYQECIAVAHTLKIDHAVIFTGKINVREYLPKIDVMVLSSISEGQPLTTLEAMAVGIPVVSTDVGSCREIIYGDDDGLGEAGLVVPIMDYKALGQAIIDISKNEEMRTNMSKVGIERVQALYTKARFIDKYKKLYEKLSKAE